MNLFPTLSLSERGFSPGAALVCAQAAELAYQDGRTVEAVARLSQATRFRFIECRGTDTQCFVAGNDEVIVAAFRGTSDWRDVLTDCQIGRVSCGTAGRVHRGCHRAFESVRGEAAEAVYEFRDRGQALLLCGHSLGGGLATLAAVQGWPGLAGVFTFGSPRVGDGAFAAGYDSRFFGRSWRVVNHADPIPWLPGLLIGYRHVGTEVFMNAGGSVLVGPPWIRKVPVLAREVLGGGLRLAGGGQACHPIRRYVEQLERVVKRASAGAALLEGAGAAASKTIDRALESAGNH